MEWLKELLKDSIDSEKLDSVVESINKEFPKHAVPKKEFNEKLEEVKLAKAQIDENKKLLDDLSKKASTVEEYEKNLNEYKAKYEQLETDSKTKISEIQKRTQFKELLVENKLHKDAIDLIVNTQNLEELTLDNGKITNSQNILAKLKTERAGLFLTETEESHETNNNTNSAIPDVETDKLRKLMGL